jgi:hypothetical protein
MRVIDRLIFGATAFRRVCIAGFLCVPVGVGMVIFLSSRSAYHESHGLATAIFSAGLGMAAMFGVGWNRERGVWMLHALLGSMIAAMALLAVYSVSRYVLSNPSRHWPEGVDQSVALVPAFLSLRVLLTAAVWNWRRFRPRSDGGAPSPRPPPEPLPVPAGLRPGPPTLSAAAKHPALQEARSR